MKRICIIIVFGLLLCACCGSSEEERTRRVTETEYVVKQMNDNINSIVVIFQAVRYDWIIVDAKTIIQDGNKVGYTFYFNEHSPINVYLEFYKADQNSLTYVTPTIGIREDEDDIYYWTIDNKWLLDDNGDKVTVDKDDNADYVPQLSIINNYWCITIDGGETWIQLYLITDKTDNNQCTCDKLNDDIIEHIGFDDEYVYFSLPTGPRIIHLKHLIDDIENIEPQQDNQEGNTNDNENTIGNGIYPPGAVNGIFTISSAKRICFAKGNLQYQASTNTWRFAEHQYEIIGKANSNISSSYSGWIDLFGWGTGNNPTNSSKYDRDYESFSDWGDNRISNGGDKPNMWRTLTTAEWNYIISKRANAAKLNGFGRVDGVKGYFFLPDNFQLPADITFKSHFDEKGSQNLDLNIYTADMWEKMEANGAVFLPVTGSRYGKDVSALELGSYWTSEKGNEDEKWEDDDGVMRRGGLYLHLGDYMCEIHNTRRRDGLAVRLIAEIKD